METVHTRVEEELFDIEEIYDAYDLRCKAWSYMIYFNLIRPNSNKDYKTPLKIIAEEFGTVDPGLLTLPPIILDDNAHIYFNTINNEDLLKEGHHVPGLPIFLYLLADIFFRRRSRRSITVAEALSSYFF